MFGQKFELKDALDLLAMGAAGLSFLVLAKISTIADASVSAHSIDPAAHFEQTRAASGELQELRQNHNLLNHQIDLLEQRVIKASEIGELLQRENERDHEQMFTLLRSIEAKVDAR